jgi:hypothetical protein
MASARAVLAILGVLLYASSGDARGAAVRPAIPLPVPAAEIAAAAGSGTTGRSLLILDLVRILYDEPEGPDSATVRTARDRVLPLLRASARASSDTVPLPLPPSVWREVIFRRLVPDGELIAAILETRETALLYYGLSALDDETLEWLASDRGTLAYVTQYPGAFAAFGRGVRIRAGHVVVPGGAAAAPLWQQVVGADPAHPGAFLRALIESHRGRTAFLYDTIAHLDPARQRFALGARLEALAALFRTVAPEWDAEERPFARPQIDPSLLLLGVRVDRDGGLTGPLRLDIWARVFRDDGSPNSAFRDVSPWTSSPADQADVDAAWLAARVQEVSYPAGRRRLETFFYGQRVLAGSSAEPHILAGTLRAFGSMPALMLTLERIGVRDAALLHSTARYARTMTGAAGDSISAFQSGLAFVERGVRARALSPDRARGLIESLIAIPAPGSRGYESRLAEWIATDLVPAGPRPPLESSAPVEEAVLRLIAGARAGRPTPAVEWEGAAYRVDPAGAELDRLRRVRQQQGGPSLDDAIANLHAGGNRSAGRKPVHEFVSAVQSVLYASYLGDPEGPAVSSGNVAIRHDFGWSGPGGKPMNAWKLPIEARGGAEGWRVQGALLGLDHALRRLALRRLDPSRLPVGPNLPVLELRTVMLTAALANPHALTDEDRDLVAAALARGRARIESVGGDAERLDGILDDAGVSGWRREAARWALANAPADPLDLSLVETFWIGGGVGDLDDWGTATLPLSGCLCLVMPRPIAWETLAGRPAAGLIATLGADVNLRVADALAARRLPAALLPAVLAFAAQDVLDDAHPAYFADWPAFCRSARALPDDRIDDYIAALAADGPLVPVSGSFLDYRSGRPERSRRAFRGPR